MQESRAAPGCVWITGASRGLGAALAHEYAAAGARVLVSARDVAALATLVIALPGPRGGRSYPLDVTAPEAVAATLAAIEREEGLPDLVILNAGTYQATPAAELATGDVRALFELNFFSIIDTLTRLLPPMRARGHGQIAVMGSVAGDIGLPYAGPYSASKAALNRLCQSLEPELARDGVAINIINPGFVATPLTALNDFPMPFIVSAERAAREIRAGLAKNAFEIRFPRRMSLAMRLLANLPDRLAFALTRRMLKT